MSLPAQFRRDRVHGVGDHAGREPRRLCLGRQLSQALNQRWPRTVTEPPRKLYIDRIAIIGWMDAARRAWARLARTATSTAIAPPTA